LKIKKFGRKGVIYSNFVYLILFYVIYFILVTTVLYFKAVVCDTEPFSTYCTEIPDSTITMMNMILYVAVPLLALAYTIMSSRPEQQYIAYPG